MLVAFRPAPALGFQPDVQFLEAGKAQARLEQALPTGLNLVLDLTVTPSALPFGSPTLRQDYRPPAQRDSGPS